MSKKTCYLGQNYSQVHSLQAILGVACLKQVDFINEHLSIYDDVIIFLSKNFYENGLIFL